MIIAHAAFDMTHEYNVIRDASAYFIL